MSRAVRHRLRRTFLCAELQSAIHGVRFRCGSPQCSITSPGFMAWSSPYCAEVVFAIKSPRSRRFLGSATEPENLRSRRDIGLPMSSSALISSSFISRVVIMSFGRHRNVELIRAYGVGSVDWLCSKFSRREAIFSRLKETQP